DEVDRELFVNDRVPGDVEGHGRLPDAGPGGQDDEFGVLEAGGELVEVDKPGGNAANRARVLAAGALVDSRVRVLEGLVERRRVPRHALLGNFEDPALGRAQELFGRLRLVVGVAKDFGAGVNEVTGDRLIADDPGVILGVRGGRGRIPQLGQVDVAANVLELFELAQSLPQDDHVNGMTVVVDLLDRLEDLLVGVEVEVVGGFGV